MNSVRPAPPVCEFFSQNSVFFSLMASFRGSTRILPTFWPQSVCSIRRRGFLLLNMQCTWSELLWVENLRKWSLTDGGCCAKPHPVVSALIYIPYCLHRNVCQQQSEHQDREKDPAMLSSTFPSPTSTTRSQARWGVSLDSKSTCPQRWIRGSQSRAFLATNHRV